MALVLRLLRIPMHKQVPVTFRRCFANDPPEEKKPEAKPEAKPEDSILLRLVDSEPKNVEPKESEEAKTALKFSQFDELLASQDAHAYASALANLQSKLTDTLQSTRESALDKIIKELSALTSEPSWRSSYSNSSEKNFFDPKLDIPNDLKGKYLFRLGNIVKSFSPKVQQLLSFETASQPDINSFNKHAVISQFQKKPGDTGSTAVQIGVLTVRIKYLTEHMGKHRRDMHNRYGLDRLVQRRKKLLAYLKRTSLEEYANVTRTLELR